MTMPQLPLATLEQVAQIQENFIAFFRIFAVLPDITLVEEAVTWTTSKDAPGSFVLRTQLSSEDLDQQIDAIVRRMAQTSRAFDWFVFPSCQPAELGERVAAYGRAGGPDGRWQLVGQIGGPGGTWMLADLTALRPAPAVSARFRIEPVRDQAGMAAWAQATIAGFGQGDHHLQALDEHPFYAAYVRHGYGPDASALHYIGYLDDQPVTSGTLMLAGGIAGLFNISTPAAFRRQGFGSAVSWWMMHEAQQRGYRQAYVWSSPMGRTVYQGVGFVPHDIGMREYSWQKRDLT
jgi:GNAT superfamily N-acetyltransferase